MSKKRRKDKELAHLRREIEVLRAQLAGGSKIAPVMEAPKEPEPATTPLRPLDFARGSEGQAEAQKRAETQKAPKTQPVAQTVDPKFIKADLLKSGILTLIALTTIAILTLIL